MNLRVTTVVGVVLGVVGIVALALPSVTTVLPANDAVVLGLGALLVLGGVREVWRRRETDPAYAETADTEEPVELSTPGAAFDRRLDRLTSVLYRGNVRHRVRDEVRDAAVDTLRRRFDYTEAEASRALREGTWTDDPFAASFFSHRPPDVGAVSRMRELARSGTTFQHRARRAIEELHRLVDSEDETDD